MTTENVSHRFFPSHLSLFFDFFFFFFFFLPSFLPSFPSHPLSPSHTVIIEKRLFLLRFWPAARQSANITIQYSLAPTSWPTILRFLHQLATFSPVRSSFLTHFLFPFFSFPFFLFLFYPFEEMKNVVVQVCLTPVHEKRERDRDRVR